MYSKAYSENPWKLVRMYRSSLTSKELALDVETGTCHLVKGGDE